MLYIYVLRSQKGLARYHFVISCYDYLEKVFVVVLSLTVEWGVGMERQDPSYGVVVHMSVFMSSGPSLRK